MYLFCAVAETGDKIDAANARVIETMGKSRLQRVRLLIIAVILLVKSGTASKDKP
jgi:hypothetical protein